MKEMTEMREMPCQDRVVTRFMHVLSRQKTSSGIHKERQELISTF